MKKRSIDGWWAAALVALAAAGASCTDSTPVVGGDAGVGMDTATDMPPTCKGDQRLCGGACVNSRTNDQNCGAGCLDCTTMGPANSVGVCDNGSYAIAQSASSCPKSTRVRLNRRRVDRA